jgi:pentatricopeptide repeat protein
MKSEDKAMEWFGEMRRMKVQANSTTYITLIDMYSKLLDVDNAMKWFDLMMKKDKDITVATYTTLIESMRRGFVLC